MIALSASRDGTLPAEFSSRDVIHLNDALPATPCQAGLDEHARMEAKMRLWRIGIAACLALAAPAKAVTLANGSFETGTLDGWNSSLPASNSVTMSPFASDGVYQLVIGFDTAFGASSHILSQSFTLSSGGVFSYAFDAGWSESFGPFGDVGLSFLAAIDGTPLSSAVPGFDTQSNGNAVNTRPVSHYDGTVTLAGGSHVLSFTFGRNPTLFGRAPFFVIDNVSLDASVAGVPEPVSWALLVFGFGMTGLAARGRHALSGALV